MKSIPMIVNVLVDDEDFERLSGISWSSNGDGYAVGYDKATRSNVLMHRVVMGATMGEIVDHINRRPWDNRKDNLRIASRSQNALNSEPRRARLHAPDNPQSPYKGVHWRPDSLRWGVQFRGKHLGLFASDRDAAVAYDAAVRESGIEGAWLNFPDGIVTGPETIRARVRPIARGTSKYRGVAFNNQRQRWQAAARIDGKNIHFGFFDDEREAALVYDAGVRFFKGENAIVNFGDEYADLPPKLAHRLSAKRARA